MANTFRCSVVTPASVSLTQDATYVSFQAFDGQKGVMPGASPFLTRLGTGVFTLNGPSGSKTLVVDGGFAQMQGDALTLLADSAVAVDAIDFHIDRHEIFGLLGPNGSGKSTTIKMILGLLRPTRGRLQVLGHAPDDVRVKSRIGYLPEESYLYRFLNPLETLDYYGKLFGLDR